MTALTQSSLPGRTPGQMWLCHPSPLRTPLDVFAGLAYVGCAVDALTRIIILTKDMRNYVDLFDRHVPLGCRQ
jgi:hypothetical protein